MHFAISIRGSMKACNYYNYKFDAWWQKLELKKGGDLKSEATHSTPCHELLLAEFLRAFLLPNLIHQRAPNAIRSIIRHHC